MKAKLSLFAIFILIGGYLAAQSNMQIKDILVSPIYLSDTIINQETSNPVSHPFITEPTTNQISTLEMYEVLFKISNIEDASEIYIKFGTTPDSGNILEIQAQIVVQDSIYFVLYDSEYEEIAGNNVKLYLHPTEQQQGDLQHVTLYVEDNQGNLSNSLYFTK